MMVLKDFLKKHLSYLMIGVFLLWLMGVVIASFSASITKPFTLDETDIASRADFVLQRGPQIFNDGTHYFAHPPLYEYTAVLIFKLFGQGEIPLRSFGILCHVLTGLFLTLIVRELSKNLSRSESLATCTLFATLFLLNPTLLQHSMAIDADTTEITVFLAMYLFAFIKFEGLKGKAFILSRFVMMFAFAMMFLSKEITPILLVISMVGFRLLNRQWKRLLIEIIFVHLLGTVVAWVAWWIYCVCTTTDPFVFIKYTLIKKAPRAVEGGHLSRVLKYFSFAMRWPIYWMGTPITVLFFVTLFQRVFHFIRHRKLNLIDILWIVGVGIFAPYTIAKPTIDMMKYQHIAFALLIAFTCVAVFQWLREKDVKVVEVIRKQPLLVACLIVLQIYLVFHYLKVGDYILFLWERGMTERWKQFLFDYYKPIIACILAFTTYALIRKKSIFAFLALALIVTQIPINSALNIKQQSAYTTAESWMNYGESGLKEAVEFLSKNVHSSMAISSRKDIGYYLRAHHHLEPRDMVLRDILRTQDPRALIALFQTGQPKFIVFDKVSLVGFTHEITRNPLAVMSKYYRLRHEFGSFKIYELVI